MAQSSEASFHAPVGYDRASNLPAEGATADARVQPETYGIARGGLNQGFDDISTLPLLGWALQNNSEPLGERSWFQGNPAAFPALTGPETSYIAANFESVSGSGTISNWLVTPEVDLENGTELTFFARAFDDQFADRLQIRLSTAGASTDVGTGATDVGDFTELLLDINPEYELGVFLDEWTEYTVTLSGLEAPTSGRFAFRYFVEDAGIQGSNGDFIGIDEVTITGGSSGFNVALNEFRVDQGGADNDEYVEIAGEADTSLDGLTLLVIGDGDGGQGVIENVTSLNGQTIPASGLFVAAEETFTLGTADFTTNLNFENGQSSTFVLVSGFTGSDGDDLDTDDDGTPDVAPWAEIVDAIGISSGDAEDIAYGAALGFEDIGPNGSFPPAQFYRASDSGAWIIGQFDLGVTDTPGAMNPAQPFANVQVIHNSPDPIAGVVDIYLNGGDTPAIDDLAFRAATPFVALPAGVNLEIGVAPGSSTGPGDIIASFPAVLPEGDFVVIAEGVVEPALFEPNPSEEDISFTINVVPVDVDLALGGATVDLLIHHGITDAPAVDVVVVDGEVVLADGIVFGDAVYLPGIPAADDVVIEVRADADDSVVFRVRADLLTFDGELLSVLASGFLTPDNEPPGAIPAALVAIPQAGGDGIILPSAACAIESDAITFGEVLIGESATEEATVTNSDIFACELTAATAEAPFAVEGFEAVTLEPQASSTFDVVYAPTTAGDDSGTLTVTTDVGDLVVALQGTGVAAPSFSVAPTALEFEVIVGGVSDVQTLTLTNSGEGDGTFSTSVMETLRRGASPDADPTAPAAFHAPQGYDRGAEGSVEGPPADARVAPTASGVLRGGFSEGFGNVAGLPDAGWALQNNSDPLGTTGWFQGNSAVFPAQAGATDHYIAANFQNTIGAGTISNWLVTPELELANGTELTFFARSIDDEFPDRLQVRLSTAGASTDVGTGATDVGDFTELLLDINPEYELGVFVNEWTEYTVTVSGLAGPTSGRFAFRYFIEDAGSDGSFIGLDEVSVTSPTGGVAFITVFPEAGTVEAGGEQDIDVTVDATDLDVGSYAVTLVIDTNDPATPTIAVPVVIDVVIPPSNEEDGVPTEFALGQNYPNPFASRTTIDYALPEAAHVTVTVYDAVGRQIAVLVDKDVAAGYYTAEWDTRGLASGVYLYRIEAGSYTETRKMSTVR